MRKISSTKKKLPCGLGCGGVTLNFRYILDSIQFLRTYLSSIFIDAKLPIQSLQIATSFVKRIPLLKMHALALSSNSQRLKQIFHPCVLFPESSCKIVKNENISLFSCMPCKDWDGSLLDLTGWIPKTHPEEKTNNEYITHNTFSTKFAEKKPHKNKKTMPFARTNIICTRTNDGEPFRFFWGKPSPQLFQFLDK